MPSFPPTFSDRVVELPPGAQFEAFLDEHRGALNGYLDGLTEEQVRRSLVASQTTLLGLVKHATFVEKIWFDEAITGRSRAEIGIPAASDESFVLDDADTIATVQQAHREACEASRRATSSLGLDDILTGHRRGPVPLRWVYLHMLRELAQHCGHAEILREQLINVVAHPDVRSAVSPDSVRAPWQNGTDPRTNPEVRSDLPM
ncbi:hypothetical protein F4553_000838 [Allocatelliglobosispora scoriae]|uniref:DinB family protein n=1 Tax=Allocatelliglobosispora scoriae TaxID=643052 RepID=A0A841BJW6_9ACTN|nr:DinB family protein [Allocatelliglobosispora scoriae]MBB5867459.1 hypothetical protein [Allocatelliglobosispora scoriae]